MSTVSLKTIIYGFAEAEAWVGVTAKLEAAAIVRIKIKDRKKFGFMMPS